MSASPSARLRHAFDILLAIAAFLTLFAITTFAQAQTTLLNVSYDPTREFYKEVNEAFGRSGRVGPRRERPHAGLPALVYQTR